MSESKYFEVYESWKSDPEAFWAEAAKDLDWVTPWDKVFDASQGAYGRWFAGAECNTCYNAVDRHADGARRDQTALIYDSPITGAGRSYTYGQLKAEVQALAAVLRDRGVTKGDRVLIYMPMVPEAAIAMLAVARLGAVHSVVFGGFAANELKTRVDDCAPKAVISASCGIEPGRVIAYKPLLDEAINLAKNKPDTCIIVQREQKPCDLIEGRDVNYASAVQAHIDAGTIVDCVPVKATDPLYI
ncbi:MAG: AMP-binding protein, partial [Notoacmeibacter sp.]|nr:AMP-binding protein [Notoacmeibacter sp.]